MMGVPIDGATQVICDNDAVVKTTTRPKSTLNTMQSTITVFEKHKLPDISIYPGSNRAITLQMF